MGVGEGGLVGADLLRVFGQDGGCGGCAYWDEDVGLDLLVDALRCV